MKGKIISTIFGLIKFTLNCFVVALFFKYGLPYLTGVSNASGLGSVFADSLGGTLIAVFLSIGFLLVAYLAARTFGKPEHLAAKFMRSSGLIGTQIFVAAFGTVYNVVRFAAIGSSDSSTPLTPGLIITLAVGYTLFFELCAFTIDRFRKVPKNTRANFGEAIAKLEKR